MKLISWNVNGLRAIVNKGFVESFRKFDADFVCLQETKMQEGQLDLEFEGYHSYWSYAERRGYSGTCIFTRHKPLRVTYGIDASLLAAQNAEPSDDYLEMHREGRVITLEMEHFFLVTCYTPNSQDGLKRLALRMRWEDDFRRYLKRLEEKKPVVVCGDLNVAHKDIDLKNPKTNHNNPGFTDEERAKMTELQESGFIDTFRFFYPTREDAYSWWSYRFHAREKNIGWRIDYFLCSKSLEQHLTDAKILADFEGSDHCPVELDMESYEL